MIEKLTFYTRHSLNDMRVNRQRTLFALLCIAAGVAAIVSLQTLGVMIQDTLTGSLQESNRGDIRIYPRAENDVPDAVIQRGKDEGVVSSNGTYVSDFFSPQGIGQVQSWFAANYPGTVISYRQVIAGPTAAAVISNEHNNKEQTFIAPYVVDASTYPLYGTRSAENGQSLSELLQAPTDIVISRNLADTLDAHVGDTLALSSATQTFTLRGIVPTKVEGGFDNFAGNLIGYYYIDLTALDLFDGALPPGASEVYVRLSDPAQTEAANDAFLQRFPYLSTTTTGDVEEQNSEISDVLNQLVVIMGLVSLLIGGIGIVNTMLVIVSRRTTEVAVLKTIGLEGDKVTTLFLVEAVLMGIFGSLIGIVLGWIAAYAIKGVAEGFLAQTLSFRITLMPPLTGLIVGVIVTTIFGFIPTLAAGQVRPNLVLRPTDTVIPKTGRARSFAALLVVMLAISLVAQALIGDLLSGTRVRAIAQSIGGALGLVLALTMLSGGLAAGWTRGKLWRRIARWVLLLVMLPVLGSLFGYAIPALLILFATFILVGILYVLLWAVIWLVGRFFPAWRLVDLKLALRSMLATKGRNASTLLALVIGVFTLSVITMLASAITTRFEQILIDEVGGNVIVFAAGGENVLADVQQSLDTVPGVESYSAVGNYDVTFQNVTDVSENNETLGFETLRERVREEDEDFVQMLNWSFVGIDARGVDSNLPDVEFYAGRQLDTGDTGPWDPEAGDYPPIIIGADEAVVMTGIEVGDLITFEIGQPGDQTGIPLQQELPTMTFRIVGMTDRRQGGITVNFGASNYAPKSAFDDRGLLPTSVSAVVEVDEDHISDVRLAMNDIPLAFVLETRLLNDLVNRVIDQFTSFPILVAGLSLVVGGIVIANSVALSTLERRREIAIMKAVGLQRERVLGMLLLEYGLMGVIGGLIGVGLGGIGLLLMLVQVFGGDLGRAIPYVTALQLMLLCIGIALAAAILTAWGASGEKPLNVLRYE